MTNVSLHADVNVHARVMLGWYEMKHDLGDGQGPSISALVPSSPWPEQLSLSILHRLLSRVLLWYLCSHVVFVSGRIDYALIHASIRLSSGLEKEAVAFFVRDR